MVRYATTSTGCFFESLAAADAILEAEISGSDDLISSGLVVGWQAIADVLGVSIKTARRYHKAGVFPVWQKQPGSPPYAFRGAILREISKAMV